MVIALAAATVVITASVVVASRRSPSTRAEASSRPPTSVAPPPALATAPTGPAPTMAGAREAAMGYLALSEQVVAMGVEAAVAAQRDAATAAAAPGLVAQLRERLGALRAAFPAGVAYRVGPLAVRVTETGPGRARVDVWYVGVLSAPGVAPYEQWRLSRYDLAWERGGWRVAAESTGSGPRPSAPVGPEPATAATLEAALAGFTSAVGP